jgi:Neuraminidase (sialidase)
LLVTTFTSLAYEASLQTAERSGAWPRERLARWQAVHRRAPQEVREKELGQWMLRSTDGGLTWSARYPCAANSPHGPIQLRSGRLLHAGKELWTGARRTGFWKSSDDGVTWRWLSPLPVRPGDQAADYHELHAAETASGRLVVHIRNENKTHENETLQSESDDAGRSWTVPHRLKVTDGTEGVWGVPSHLLRLHDGRLLMTYGHRRAPLGNQARLSTDDGRTWSTPIVISADGTSGDLGYPSTVEIEDRTLLTVWYEVQQGASAAVLRQARWSLL